MKYLKEVEIVYCTIVDKLHPSSITARSYNIFFKKHKIIPKIPASLQAPLRGGRIYMNVFNPSEQLLRNGMDGM